MSLKFSNILSFFFLISLLTACGGIRPASGSSSDKNFETFYTGQQSGTQYFVKPLEFKTENNEYLFVDITFRDGNFKKDSATINYTYLIEAPLQERETLNAIDKESSVGFFTAQNPSRLFQERDKDNFRSRFTGKVENTEMLAAFTSPNLNFTLTVSENTLFFTPTAKTERQLKELNDRLFSLYLK